MELFVVNRYTGEENAPVQTPDESQLKKILIEKAHRRQKLAKRISQIKNNSNVCTGIISEADVNNVNYQTCALINPSYTEDDNQLMKDKNSKNKRKRKPKILDEETESDSTKNQKLKIKKKEIGQECGKLANSDFEFSNGTDKGQVANTEPFSVLGSEAFLRQTKTKRSIPQWLANPSVVSVDLKNLDTPVDSVLGLDEKFRNCLKNNGISHFFPDFRLSWPLRIPRAVKLAKHLEKQIFTWSNQKSIQSQVMAWLLKNTGKPNFYWASDICVSAPTGSGKTLAFVLPILQDLQYRVTPQIRAIVILPVQDLAVQVYKVFETYCKSTNLKVLLLSKKCPFPEEQNLIHRKDDVNGFTTLVDIIITTPGRLVDHLMKTNGLNLCHMKYLVIDEADRVMEDMQNDWLYHLNKKILLDTSKSYQTPFLTLNTLSTKRKLPQKLLFSATLSQDPEKLQELGLFQPKLFTSIVAATDHGNRASSGQFIGKYTTPAELEEYYTLCTKAMKPLVLNNLLLTKSWRNVLCFVNSTQATERLSFLLRKMNEKVVVKSISAKLSPVQRDKLIEDFGKGEIDVLISSDTLARGIDIPNVKYVISYNRPKYLKTYIHRIGRTGRAGNKGVSLILLTQKEEKHFIEMINAAGKKSVKHLKIEEDIFEQYTDKYQMALDKLSTHLEKLKLRTLSGIKMKKIKNKSNKMRIIK